MNYCKFIFILFNKSNRIFAMLNFKFRAKLLADFRNALLKIRIFLARIIQFVGQECPGSQGDVAGYSFIPEYSVIQSQYNYHTIRLKQTYKKIFKALNYKKLDDFRKFL